MRIWLERTLTGVKAHDDEARAAFGRIKVGTVFEADVVTRQHRSLQWHRKYWLLMSMLADNVEEVDIAPPRLAMMTIHDADDMHTAIKILTGHVHTYTTEVQGQIHKISVPKPTNFREMEPDAWAKYWPKVLDAVHRHVLPGVNEYVEEELARMAS